MKRVAKAATSVLVDPGNVMSNVAKARSSGSKKRHEMSYGSLRFSGKDVLTKDNQPSIYKDILRAKDPEGVPLRQRILSVTQAMESNKSINNCVFPVTLSKESDARTSIELLPKEIYEKHNRIGMNLRENDPKATEAAVRIAYELAQSNIRPSGINLENWSNGDARTQELQNAMSHVGIERDAENPNKYYISSRTQQQNIEPQGQSTNNNDQITSLPRTGEPPFQGPLRQREEFPSELPPRPEKPQSTLSRLTSAMKGLTLGRDGSYTNTKVDSRPTSRDGH
jgi:hypothetical protein